MNADHPDGAVAVASHLVREAIALIRTLRCPCHQRFRGSTKDSVDAFNRVRAGCPALAQVFLPDSVWPAVHAQAKASPGLLGHRSHLLYAFERGELARVTAPIHLLLLSGDGFRPDISDQYRKDLRERWILKTTDQDRQKYFKMYFGKLVELQVAHWLTRRGWRVTNLEALGAPTDIQATWLFGQRHTFEVKYFGQGTDDFELILRSVKAGEPIADSLPVMAPPNYLLFRVYQAAKHLVAVPRPRIVILVIDEQTWANFHLPLRHNWINWTTPAFLGDEPGWRKFMEETVRPQYPNIEADLAPALSELDAVWILRLRPGYVYQHVETIKRLPA